MWFGREGRHGVCRVVFYCCVFQTIAAAQLYRMYAIQRQFNQDHTKSYKRLVIIIYGTRIKKDNKKAS